MSRTTGEIRLEIEENKLILEQKYALAMTAARKIRQRHEELTFAEENRDLRGGTKQIARHEIAEGVFVDTVKKFFFFLDGYDDAVGKLNQLYAELVSVGCAKESKKARLQAERLEQHEQYKRDRIFDIIRYVSGIEDMYSEYVTKNGRNDASSKANVNNKTEPSEREIDNAENSLAESLDSALADLEYPKNQDNKPDLARMDTKGGFSASTTGHGIAPDKIDISKIVEDSVSVAMSKFNMVLEKRISTAMARQSGEARSNASPQDLLNMHFEMVDFELEISNKLAELTEKLKRISLQIIDVEAACMQLSTTQNELFEKQKDVTKMQSFISDEQTILSEKQRGCVENQAALNEQQTKLAALSEELMHSNDAIAKSSSEILTFQRELLSLQQSALASGTKSLELQRALTLKQSEVTELQKQALTEHKQVKRKARR